MTSKATPKEIGDGLFSLFLKFAKSDSLDESISEIIKKHNKERANWESVYLKIMAIDFGVYSALENNDKRNEILDVFYKHIESMAAGGNIPNKFFMQDLKNRQLAYSKTINQYSPEKCNNRTLLEMVGEKFTQVAGTSSNEWIIAMAANVFGVIYAATRDFVKSFQIA